MRSEVVIIGSGISGLSLGNMLKETGVEAVIFESNKSSGGLIRCSRENQVLFHRVGGHVFNSNKKVVLDWFWSKFDREKEFIPAIRNAKIWLHDKYIGYPIENNLYELPSVKVEKILYELLEILKNKEVKNDSNFKQFLINRFGSSLYNIYFGPYNSKIWRKDLSEIPLKWLDGKLPMPSIVEILTNNVLRKSEVKMVHSTFWYPANNGSQFIVDRLSENLRIEHNTEIKSLTFSYGKLLVNDSIYCKYVVYTGNIRKLINIIKISDDKLNNLLSRVRKFCSNGTSNVLCETDDTNISWLYLPEPELKAHRIIYTGNFSHSNNGNSKRKTCVVEFSGICDEQAMLEDIAKLPGNLTPIAFNIEKCSYVIHDFDTRKLVAALKKNLQQYGIILLGRFAEWEYYNMDICIERSMNVRNRILNI